MNTSNVAFIANTTKSSKNPYTVHILTATPKITYNHSEIACVSFNFKDLYICGICAEHMIIPAIKPNNSTFNLLCPISYVSDNSRLKSSAVPRLCDRLVQ